MKRTMLVAGLLLTATLMLLPSASAWHCAEEPLADEVQCEANHWIDYGQYLVNWTIDFVQDIVIDVEGN